MTARTTIAVRALTMCAGVCVLVPAAAGAEVTPTSQAQAARATWLAYAPAPAQPAAVCLVDSGVTINGDIAGAVTRRVALDGGTLDDVDTVGHHGTLMAMIAAAAVNQTGMIGAAPTAVKIVSVRAATPTTDGSQPKTKIPDFERGIAECTKYRTSDNVRVIELALGADQQLSDTELEQLDDAVATAHSHDISVVAAAGNAGGPVLPPASTPSVLAVGAGDTNGVLCAFSSHGNGLDLVAPGCGLDTADPVSLDPETGSEGTSQASAFAAAVLGALRAYRPDLSYTDAEALLTGNAPDGVLDADSAFRAASLNGTIDAGAAVAPAPPTPPANPQSVIKPGSLVSTNAVAPQRWKAPVIVAAQWRPGQSSVKVRVRGMPRGAELRVVAQRRRGKRFRTVNIGSTSHSILVVPCSIRPTRLLVSYVDLRGDAGRDSKTTRVSVKR